MNLLFITTGMLSERLHSNSYQESLFDRLVDLGHQVSVLCTASLGYRFDLLKPESIRGITVYKIVNGGIYPGKYPQGGVGTRTPMRDIFGGSRLHQLIRRLVQEINPELVSIQGLMGFPLQAIEEIKADGYPTILTAHDYFALCPTAHLFGPDSNPCYLPGDELICEKCCSSTLSYPAFRVNNWINETSSSSHNPNLKVFWSKARGLVTRADGMLSKLRNEASSQNYQKRRFTAVAYLRHLTVLHCISAVQAKVYRQLAGPIENLVTLPLQSPSVTRTFSVPRTRNECEPVRFAALNVGAEMKGGLLLGRTAERLNAKGHQFELDIYGPQAPAVGKSLNIQYHGRYSSGDLDRIATASDFSILPSIWDETLGFTALEMLARGVPVLASQRAGASEFVDHGVTGLVFDPDDEDALLRTMCKIIDTPGLARDMRAALSERLSSFKTFNQHVVEMEGLYRSTTERHKAREN